MKSKQAFFFATFLIALLSTNPLRLVAQEPDKTAAYLDGRPRAELRLEASDSGVVLKHGDGPNECDLLGAREAIVFEHQGTYYLHYDGAGRKGWLACLATSNDLTHWTKKGTILDFGSPGEPDSASASSPWVYFEDGKWHMFYVATVNASRPDFIPGIPYMTAKAQSDSPSGPWIKQKNVVPFRPQPGSYYADTASPGCVIRHGKEYLMFFSAAQGQPFKRTLGLARTNDLNGSWQVSPEPVVPREEQIENSSLYFETADQTWFLFTNHVGIDQRGEFIDSIWVYWSKDPLRWDPKNKAVVLDGNNCTWSKDSIGMPSVLKVGNRLAVLYDGAGGESVSNMKHDIGLAWLDLPLAPPSKKSK